MQKQQQRKDSPFFCTDYLEKRSNYLPHFAEDSASLQKSIPRCVPNFEGVNPQISNAKSAM